MDIYYIKEHIACTDQEKIACMKTVKLIRRLLKIGRRDGMSVLCEEIQRSSQFQRIPLFQIALPLFDVYTNEESMRKILENYIVLSNYSGKDLLEALIILEGFIGITKVENMKIIMETICSYFGIDFRDKFYQSIKPSFLDENCF